MSAPNHARSTPAPKTAAQRAQTLTDEAPYPSHFGRDPPPRCDSFILGLHEFCDLPGALSERQWL
ncbi:hypothetical protein HBI56_039460 [Parastagonospora nodorum]|nr:hypothetical protein HBI46_135080 [Parastagonospora nodorum]KAH6096216.1 hypothetical protein HBI65_101260 [Parastagonospora nodorum]KAH6540849.1 hypothetical protein HBI56_039460 [Parastagonospora nodorum]